MYLKPKKKNDKKYHIPKTLHSQSEYSLIMWSHVLVQKHRLGDKAVDKAQHFKDIKNRNTTDNS